MSNLQIDKDTYTESDMVHKEGVEAIRQNVAMYAGDSSYAGFHHLASEVIDNSIDETSAGYASKINVIIYKDGSCSIEDDGRGIPAEPHPQYKISTLEIALTKIHASAKFEKNAYKKFSSGLHGIGLKLCNALSESLEIIVQRDGKKYYQQYREGKPLKPVEVISESKLHGTYVKFKPAVRLFREVKELDRNWFLHRLRDLSYLNPGIEIYFKDEREPIFEKTYIQKNGICDYVGDLLGGSQALLKDHFNIALAEPDGILKDDGTQDEMKLELAFNYNDSDSEIILSFTNNIFNKDGGSHTAGFLTALTASFNSYLKKNPELITKKEQKELEGKALRGEDYRQGLHAILSLKLSRPQFAGQTKDRLVNSEIQGSIRGALGKALNKWIEENPLFAKKVLEKAILNFRAHLAGKKAAETVKKDTKSLLGSDRKLKDCTEDDPSKTELFIVEGDSAGGSSVNARNPSYQAILPLGGKILNTWKATAAKMLSHDEISSLIRSLGTGILDSFEPEKCRYNKIIIMCDADVDGLHIRTLLLTFLFQRMRKLIEDGKVYIAQPPLYKIQNLYKDTKCQHCGGVPKKAANCGGCAGNGKAQQYITYDSDFYSTMSQLGLEGAILTHVDGESITGKALQKIIDAIATGTAASLGLKDLSLSPQPVGEMLPINYYLKNSTKAKPVEMSHLLQLPQALIELGQNCVEVGRFKGLGEMNPIQLWDTTMNPETRILLQIKIDDIVNANTIFETLMGSKADARREFISAKKSY